MYIKIGISNRHIHLTKEDYEILFGNAPLLKYKDLTQYGQFASTFKVTLKTDKNVIENVRVLGPLRNYTQVEISKTDAYHLGINPPVRDSGDLEDSAPITIEGPNGSIFKESNCIIASRHIHIHTDELEEYGLVDKQIVSVKVSTEKGGIMDNVLVRAGNYYFEMHIDTDDANAHLLKNGDTVQIIK